MTAHQILNRAPIGSLLKGANLKGGSNTTIRDYGYLAMIRQCPCVKCGLDVQPGIDAAHVRMQSGAFNKHGDTGKKPSDCWTIPLCSGPMGCHEEQHKKGERGTELNNLHLSYLKQVEREILIGEMDVCCAYLSETESADVQW